MHSRLRTEFARSRRRTLAHAIVAGTATVAPALAAVAQESSNWFRDAAIAPDGSRIVFCHAGDLYEVPTAGGRAVPISIHAAHESGPVFSKDGSRIAFASDRFGNLDVFVMDAVGGPARRLTHHSVDDVPSDFTESGDAVLFRSSRGDSAASPLFPSRVLSELYRVSVDGGTPTMVLTTPAVNARLGDGDGLMLYEDVKGYEDPLRKHHVSSIARDVWMHDTRTGGHVRLTEHEGEDRNPVFGERERELFFLSERAGDFNVFRMPLSAGAEAEQLTRFERHPVRGLSRANDGTLAFTWHGDLYTLVPGEEPRLVEVAIGVDGRATDPEVVTNRNGATEFAASPSGKEVAFVHRGEVFVTSVEFGTTVRITDTPEQERSVSFSPDGRSLLYAGERDGSWNVYETTLGEDELHFFSATRMEESPVLATDAEEFQPTYSPDGKRIAFLRDRHQLEVLERESGETTIVLPGERYYSYSDGDMVYDWAPDSNWLAVGYYDAGRFFYEEIGLVPADRTADPVNLSSSGYSDMRPAFAMGGELIVWATDRYGERAHGSWGGEADVVGVFLTQDAFDRFRLSKEEHALAKELAEKDTEKGEEESGEQETEAGEDEEKTAEAKQDDAKDDDEGEQVEPLEFELDDLDTRRVRLTTHSSDLSGFAVAPKGDVLYYLARFEKGYDLWKRDVREESVAPLAKLGASSASMELSKDGKTIFLLADGTLSKVETASGKRTPIAFAATMTIDRAAERAHMLEHIWRQAKQKFYRPDMHGVDWTFYRDAYAAKLPGIATTGDFATAMSEMLGELNASHTGAFARRNGGPGSASTAALGIIVDHDAQGDGLAIAEVLPNGPLDRASFDVEGGDVIVAIDGIRLDRTRNVWSQLDGKVGERTRLTISDADGERDVVVRPISGGAESQLLYERWTRRANDLVVELSDGRLGYAHVRGMDDANFRAFFEQVFGEHADKEALIVDTRFNGGGWLTDDLVSFLTGERYTRIHPRNDFASGRGFAGAPPTRWTKPSVVVMSESNYSDAHFFPWAYSTLGIGETIGMPVPGTATAVWWETLHTGEITFGIPQVGIRGVNEGDEFLENQQLEPDHEVAIDPRSAAEGRDTQLEKAVRVLLEQLDG